MKTLSDVALSIWDYVGNVSLTLDSDFLSLLTNRLILRLRDNLPKDNLPKHNLPNVTDNLPNLELYQHYKWSLKVRT